MMNELPHGMNIKPWIYMCQKIVIDSQRKKDGRMYELKHRV